MKKIIFRRNLKKELNELKIQNKYLEDKIENLLIKSKNEKEENKKELKNQNDKFEALICNLEDELRHKEMRMKELETDPNTRFKSNLLACRALLNGKFFCYEKDNPTNIYKCGGLKEVFYTAKGIAENFPDKKIVFCYYDYYSESTFYDSDKHIENIKNQELDTFVRTNQGIERKAEMLNFENHNVANYFDEYSVITTKLKSLKK